MKEENWKANLFEYFCYENKVRAESEKPLEPSKEWKMDYIYRYLLDACHVCRIVDETIVGSICMAGSITGCIFSYMLFVRFILFDLILKINK